MHQECGLPAPRRAAGGAGSLALAGELDDERASRDVAEALAGRREQHEDRSDQVGEGEQEQPRGGQAAIEEDDKARTFTLNEVDKVHLSFPFDVAKDLNEMADIEGRTLEAHDRVPMRKAINPYWLPEDYQTP